ncbi:DoxX-like family protein [Litorivita sp. NS0012-18]|uniref:DoxX-like family protein n=1 Tax=Litorivita sp. NS0012-18 TaxID=3127655 RepID=UPI00333E8AC1
MMHLGPISRTAVEQLAHGAEADSRQLYDTLPRPPRGFSSFAKDRPAGSQDLWHARLYLMRPVLRLALAMMWLVSALIGLFMPSGAFLPLVETSLPDGVLIMMARLGGLADLAIGAAVLRGWRPRRMAAVQAAMIAVYTAAFTFLSPALWLLPMGGLLKNIPLLAMIAVLYILEDER